MLRQFLASLIFALTASVALHAQAIPAAERLAVVQVGAGLNIVRPDYNAGTIFGYSIYGDFDFTPHIGIEGDVHIGNVITPGDVGESSFLLGPRYVFHHGRFHPYAKLLLGVGIFTFEPVYYYSKSSSSTHKMYAFGGGVDVTVKRRLNVRAFDLEYQRWPGFTANGLTPLAMTVGAAYRF
ncbi:outer membrane beta-barrel protein [Edaphobacter aggregans]|uniref:outer membrane beta-barrel protein n=1 Tax=Edaphobacter aggregans TaxID=570835 RepID=UPI00055605C4|nr:outer membrane beta-barrel protein [Edaphobacter aggregans]